MVESWTHGIKVEVGVEVKLVWELTVGRGWSLIGPGGGLVSPRFRHQVMDGAWAKPPSCSCNVSQLRNATQSRQEATVT